MNVFLRPLAHAGQAFLISSTAFVWHAAAMADVATVANASSDSVATAAQSLTLPASSHLAFDVEGKVSGVSYSAKASLDWALENGRYRAFQQVRMPLLGSRSQLSHGVVGESFLQPERFEDSRKKRFLVFDSTANTVLYDKATTPSSIPVGAQDRLSVFFQLAGVVAASPETFAAVSSGKTITIPTVSFNKHDVWVFEPHGLQDVQLPAGSIKALAFKRLPRKQDDQQAFIWLAPDLQYLPVQIKLSESDGDFLNLMLNSVQNATKNK